jgi:trehalose 6-phosphate phosphatase
LCIPALAIEITRSRFFGFAQNDSKNGARGILCRSGFPEGFIHRGSDSPVGDSNKLWTNPIESERPVTPETEEKPETEERLGAFFGTFAAGATPLLLLDYDGTMAPFRVNRFLAKPWAGVRDLLSRIQKQGRTHMAVITGRPAGEIAPLLGLDTPLEVWGLHGAARIYADGRRELEVPVTSVQEELDEVRALLQRDSLGGLFEDKPNAAVMHWRGASPHRARLIEKRTRQLFEPLALMDGLGLLEFESGLELRVGRDKGGAVESILSEAEADAPVAYLGDDLTDEAAFRAVNRVGGRGLSVLMRRQPRETDADIWLRPPEELKGFLKRWIEAAHLSLGN